MNWRVGLKGFAPLDWTIQFNLLKNALQELSKVQIVSVIFKALKFSKKIYKFHLQISSEFNVLTQLQRREKKTVEIRKSFKAFG